VSTTHKRAGGMSPLVVVLLVFIFAALIGLIVVISQSGKSGAQGSLGGSPGGKPKPLAAGESVDRSTLEASDVTVNTPANPIDTARIRETYKAGQRFRTLTKASMKTRASAKDWGVEQVLTLCYAAEGETIRTIESNDGNTLVETVEFTKARTLGIFCNLDDVRIDVGPAGQLLLLGLDWYTMTPAWSSLDGASAKQILEGIPAVQGWANRALTDQATRTFAFVDSLQGKKVRIEYVNGKGVTNLTAIGCTLSGDDQAFLVDIAGISDPYVLPNLDSKEGDSWTIRGEDFLPVLDPSLRSTMTGTVTLVRGTDTQLADGPAAQLKLNDGILTLHSVEETSEMVGRWAPRGEMTYSFGDKIVAEAHLSGSLSIDKHSTKHILFEARQVVEPDYEVVYSCELLK
jgi:hypothetical protein